VGGGSSGFNPLGSRAQGPAAGGNTDGDGWGADAPPITRSQLEKVAPAYKPTKVNIAELTYEKEPSRYTPPQPKPNNGSDDVVKGEYQPIGKVDIAALRRQAKDSDSKDDRPTIVKGAYEPVGKVDIAAIRARAQNAPTPPSMSPAATGDDERPKSLAERSAAFSTSERIQSLPKPKVANKFGGSSTFTGTRAPAPGGFDSKPAPAAPVGTASRTFADEGGKTPAQIWAEKKARQGGSSGGAASSMQPQISGGGMQPIGAQQSGGGGWKSGYTGKSWGAVHTTHTGKSAGSNVSEQRTGQDQEQEAPTSPAGGISSIRDRFTNAPPPMDLSSKPTGGRGIPGLPSRPSADQVPAEHHVDIPSPPRQPRSPTPPDSPELRPSSPIRVAMPVSRTREPEPLEPAEEEFSHAPIPTRSLAQAADTNPDYEDEGQGRGASEAVAKSSFGAGAEAAPANTGGKRAVVHYDYEKAEDNELELHEGGYVTNIEMVDEDWWHGENDRGETGLFPSNYVELIEDDEPAAPAASKGNTATAQYDYEAAEDNELSFPEGATVENVVSSKFSLLVQEHPAHYSPSNSLMMTGGLASTAARKVFSHPIMSLSMVE
jgi:drebrin-like protein